MHNSITIFDSLSHPMPNGKWLQPKYDGENYVSNLISSMKEANIKWAFASGMGSKIGNYNENTYSKYIYESCQNEDIELFPLAFIDINAIRTLKFNSLNLYFKNLSNLGYVGIKLHPRLSNFQFSNKLLPTIIDLACENNLIPFLCTYVWGQGECNNSCSRDLMKLLENISMKSKLVLVHGGAVRLLEYVEICRAFPNTLLDLSLTLCKYRGSSLDIDIKFCFEQFDRRICIGSDGPEYSSYDLRTRFEYFSTGLSIEKKTNIAHGNIFKFTNLS